MSMGLLKVCFITFLGLFCVYTVINTSKKKELNGGYSLNPIKAFSELWSMTSTHDVDLWKKVILFFLALISTFVTILEIIVTCVIAIIVNLIIKPLEIIGNVIFTIKITDVIKFLCMLYIILAMIRLVL